MPREAHFREPLEVAEGKDVPGHVLLGIQSLQGATGWREVYGVIAIGGGGMYAAAARAGRRVLRVVFVGLGFAVEDAGASGYRAA